VVKAVVRVMEAIWLIEGVRRALFSRDKPRPSPPPTPGPRHRVFGWAVVVVLVALVIWLLVFVRPGHNWAGPISVLVGAWLAMGSGSLATFAGWRSGRPELAGLVLGLGLGGVFWILVSGWTTGLIPLFVSVEPPPKVAPLDFYQEHAYDVLGAGGLIGAIGYFITDRKRLTRATWLAVAFGLLGAMTAFTAKGDSSEVVASSVDGVFIGVITGVWGVIPPTLRDLFRGKRVSAHRPRTVRAED
jgi:hypothetical protein